MGQPLMWPMNHPCRQFADGHFVLKIGEFNNTDEDCSVPLASGAQNIPKHILIYEQSHDRSCLLGKPGDHKVHEFPLSQVTLD